MSISELVFIPCPGAGHLPPTVELAKLLLHRDQGLSIAIVILKNPFEPKHTTTETPTSSTSRMRFIDIPANDESTISQPGTFVSGFIENQKPHVRTIIRELTESADSVRLIGLVFDMFCATMVDVANEFGAPTYIYFTSSIGTLRVMLYLQAKHDEEDYDVTELENDLERKLTVPGYKNPIPAKVIPDAMFNKGVSKTFIDLSRRFRESKGIIVNTFQELETHGVESFSSSSDNVPPVFPVGPILNMNDTTKDGKSDEIITRLNDQPENSVVFLCFGSMGRFNEEQVKEIAVAIEKSGHRFLWSHRRPPPKESMEYPKDYENPEEVLPVAFLDRTSNVGKVIGWAPQMAVLSHPSVGGFVSHCGWNSTLESIWCGVPVAAWPLYAEQQLNAFELVVELGMAVEIKMDYRTNMRGSGSDMMVSAEEIEIGIRRLMSDGEMRKKVKEMKEKSGTAVSEGGSSYTFVGRFIDHAMCNVQYLKLPFSLLHVFYRCIS